MFLALTASLIISAFVSPAAFTQDATKFRGPPTAGEIQQETDRITARAKNGDVEAQKMLWAEKVGKGGRPAPGDLESGTDLKCITAKEAKNTYTPADLYKAVADCIMTGNYETGDFIWILAGVYGAFDMLRVADETAHTSLQALMLNNFSNLPPDQKGKFQNSVLNYMGPQNLAHACVDVAKIGPPAYYPRYMVQHGMAAFTGTLNGDGLVKNFDEQTAWTKAMNSYMHCDKSPDLGRTGSSPQNSQDKKPKP